VAPGWDDLFHILNPSAARRPSVEAFFESSSWPRLWIDRTSHPTHLETAMAWAVNEGRRDVAIWGGDGTLSRAVNALESLNALDKVRIALVPAGTCNDLARRLGIAVWDRLFIGSTTLEERRIDVGMLSHAEGRRAFVNNAGFGRRAGARGEKRPHPLLDIFRLRAQPIEVVADDARREMQALLGIVFNAPYFGCGLHFSTDIAPDDGRLDAYFLTEQPRWKVLWSFVQGRSGGPFSNAGAVAVSGASIRVRTTGELFPQTDGERASEGAVREIEFRLLPNSLTLLLPAGASSQVQ
jgi:diacylglycerol kinase (ATP)